MAKDKEKIMDRFEKAEAVVKSKADIIRESALTDAQKEQYLRDIGEIKDEFNPEKISFDVYATIRKVPKNWTHAMKLYPSASGVGTATLAEWDAIFKNF